MLRVEVYASGRNFWLHCRPIFQFRSIYFSLFVHALTQHKKHRPNATYCISVLITTDKFASVNYCVSYLIKWKKQSIIYST